jgi:hypothetical protein
MEDTSRRSLDLKSHSLACARGAIVYHLPPLQQYPAVIQTTLQRDLWGRCLAELLDVHSLTLGVAIDGLSWLNLRIDPSQLLEGPDMRTNRAAVIGVVPAAV